MTSSEVKIKPGDGEISEYISDFEEGSLQVPLFQRDFVWDTDQKLELFRSIANGYPIGSVLFWKPNKETLEIFENIDNKQTLGGYFIPPKNNDSLYILDGFQRLSTLIGCLIDPNKAKNKGIQRNDDTWYKEFNFVYNLDAEDFEVVKVKDFSKLKSYQIPIHKLVDNKNFYYFQRTLFNENNNQIELYLKRYEEIGDRFSKYKIPNIKLFGGTISEAIEIFQKLNSQGSKITIDWVISAILIKKDPSFRLGDEITNLIKNELKSFEFHTIKREVILNCIFNSFGKAYFDTFSKNDKKVEDLVKRGDFIDITKKTFKAIIKAAKFMYEALMVLDAKLIPYNNQFIFITDFFTKIQNPTPSQLEKLKKWFWITTYSNYFTIYNLSKQRNAYEEFQKFLDDENADPIFYDNDSVFTALSFPDKITMGSVRGKALALFMINYSANNTINFNSNANPTIFGYKTFKLFSKKENMIPENTVFNILRSNADVFNSNDIFDRENENLFITNEMVEQNKEGNYEKILELRKNLINHKEREFITKMLKIDYEQ
jgi:uncharacterized protein with ParB-like and HNH nuclease domain